MPDPNSSVSFELIVTVECYVAENPAVDIFLALLLLSTKIIPIGSVKAEKIAVF
jgi:hypothetical protein